MEFEEIKKKIKKFNNNDSDSKNIVEEKKNYRGNQHDLTTFIQRVSFEDYKKKMKKTYIQKNEKVFSDANEIQKMLEQNQYKKKWGRLDNYCKKMKIKEYLNNMINNGDLNTNNYDKYFNSCMNRVRNKKLNKKNEIEYDDIQGKIKKIYNLTI